MLSKEFQVFQTFILFKCYLSPLLQSQVSVTLFRLHWQLVVVGVELLPPLLSSVPPLPDDSVGEEDGIMGIFVR